MSKFGSTEPEFKVFKQLVIRNLIIRGSQTLKINFRNDLLNNFHVIFLELRKNAKVFLFNFFGIRSPSLNEFANRLMILRLLQLEALV